jgi:hypothetical protein
MSLTINTKAYTADSFGSNAVGYIGPAKTASVKDDLVLRRTAAKPTKVFSGVARAQAKLTRTHTLTNALTPTFESISDVNVSIPVGTAAADIDAICADLGSYVQSADFKSLLKTQKINF